jgi:hypothetical protein
MLQTTTVQTRLVTRTATGATTATTAKAEVSAAIKNILST